MLRGMKDNAAIWNEESQKLDNKIAREIVVFKSFDTLKKKFPSPQAMVEYSNRVYAYPHRRNSVLALLTQAGDMELVRRFWQHYFPGGRDKKTEADFLLGTNQIGQTADYHYFREAMPEGIKIAEKQFLHDKETAVLPQNEKIYKLYLFFKKRRIKINDGAEKGRNTAVFSPDLRIRENKNGTFAVDNVTGLAEKNGILVREAVPFSQVLLYNTENGWGETVILDATEKKTFRRQVFEQLSYPEEFFWAGKVIDSLEAKLRGRRFDNDRNRETYFAAHNGIVQINRQAAENKKGKPPVQAYMLSNARAGEYVYLHLGINADNIANKADKFDETMRHELIHGMDLHGDEAFSESDIAKMMMITAYVKRHKVIGDIVQGEYKPQNYVEEFLPRIIEEGLKGDNLGQTAGKLFARYEEYKLRGDEKGIERLNNLVRDSLSERKYQSWKELSRRFDDYVKVDDFYKNIYGPVALKLKPEEEKFFRAYFSFFGGLKSGNAAEKKIENMAENFLGPQKKLNILNLCCKKLTERLY